MTNGRRFAARSILTGYLFDMAITKYDTLREFFDSLPKIDPYGDKTWGDLPSYKEAKSGLWGGDKKCLSESNRLLDQLESDGLELAVAQWEHGRTGFIPCVPSYLAGSPESMRFLGDTLSETASIRVVVDMFISGSYSHRDLIRRGTTILALVRKLQTVRPVELLFCCGSLDKTRAKFITMLVKLDTNPLDLTTMSYLLGHPGFTRKICFAWLRNHGAGSSIPYCYETQEKLGDEIGPNDLYISGAILSRDVLDNPVQWVNEQVRKYASVLEDA